MSILANELKQRGLTDILGELVKLYGNQVSSYFDEHGKDENAVRACMMQKTLNSCWQFAREFSPDIEKKNNNEARD